MLYKLIFTIAATLALSGCVTFYASPSSKEPAAIFVEKSERGKEDDPFEYRRFTLAEIDGMPVSHFGSEIRVHPGTRHMVFNVRYLNDYNAGAHEATFELQLPVEAGIRYQIGGLVYKNLVKLTISDTSKPEILLVDLTTMGEAVPRDLSIVLPRGGVIKIPSPR